jgi:hypothetical protein
MLVIPIKSVKIKRPKVVIESGVYLVEDYVDIVRYDKVNYLNQMHTVKLKSGCVVVASGHALSFYKNPVQVIITDFNRATDFNK